MAKTHTAQIAELRAQLDEQKTQTEELLERLQALEAQRDGLRAFVEPLEGFLMPGSVVGDLLGQMSADPENAEEIFLGELEGLVEELMGGVRQHVNALAEGHGINPNPVPTLYSAYMKGFNLYNENSR